MLNSAQQWEPLEDFDPKQNPTPGELDPEHEAYFERWINLQQQHAVESGERAFDGAENSSTYDDSPVDGVAVDEQDLDHNTQHENPLLGVKRHFDQILIDQQKDEAIDSQEYRKAWSLWCSLRRLETIIERCHAIEDMQDPDLAATKGKFFLLVWTVDELLLFKDDDRRCVSSTNFDCCKFTYTHCRSGFARECKHWIGYLFYAHVDVL